MTDSTDPRQLSHMRKPSPELQKAIDQLQAGFQALHVHWRKKIIDQMEIEGFRFPDLLDHSLRGIAHHFSTIETILHPRYQYIKETEPATDHSGRDDNTGTSAGDPT